MNAGEFQKQIQELQAGFQTRIQECALNGKSDQIAALVAEMQAKMAELTEKYQEAIVAASAVSNPTEAAPFYGKEMTELDLHRLAYGADTSFLRTLAGNGALVESIREINESEAAKRGRRRLLARAMRLTPNISRPIFEIVERCRSSLSLKIPFDLFVVQDRMFNAGILAPVDGKYSIYFTSGLLENFTPDEIAFVLGHELGHALFHHHDVPVDLLASNYGHVVSPKDIIRMRSWQRAAELSADRAGLLCSRDFKSASQAFFKLSSGITSSTFNFTVSEYMEQYSDLVKYIQESSADKMEEFYSSHPLSPIRLRALDLFSQSAVFRELGGKSANDSLAFDQMESEIRAFMSMMEPDYLDDKSELAAQICEFIFNTGVMVAKSDGQVDPSECEALGQLLRTGDPSAQVQAALALSDDEIIQRIVTSAKKINFELPPVKRLNIIRDIFSIACADGQLAPGEINEMAKVCGVLQISSSFLEDLICAVKAPEENAA